MPAENIHTLFAQLRLEHFLVYLPDNGWCRAPEQREDRMRFELPDADAPGEPPYVLLLPRSNQSPKCMKQLQKAIYNLSGIEKRQPIEIIRDLFSFDPATVPAARPQPPIRVRLHNLHTTEMTLQIASRTNDNTLLPGEAIEILYYPSEGALVEIGFMGSTVQINDQDAE
jgi:hypothetical protein